MTTNVLTNFFRGTTVFFQTTFYDQFGNIVQPVSAFANIWYLLDDQATEATTQVTLTPPTAGNTAWTWSWDSRGAGAAPVNWSVHSQNTGDGPPVAVEDGAFNLVANNANQMVF